MKEIIDFGEIGEVQLMRSSLSFVLQQLEGNIRMSKELGGGSLYDLGCYCIHAIRSIMQREPTKVYAVGNHHLDYVDLSMVAVMELENGRKTVFDCGMNMSDLRQSYEVVGSKGKIDVPIAYVPLADRKGFVRVETDHAPKEKR
ncbi:Oxidoreductase family, C-terminal alpha/beta domain [Melghirimyces thermohalophilus]|uniref:Oxidoreductase family, C-terminal alpha/beta domain n=2 Tax=Melghirimyces thermohalophilus TaxID=1236220 RepID=A0A1G6L9T1_9BACL|nr:Oxidoreductase family, C-terminal alpha/beta domain [Melghirimyces thermohalophilus]